MLYPSLSFRNSTLYLLDTYLATAAYSLRQLKAGVTSVVRVRRDFDNAESDFNPTEITDGTLATWVGANNGFVTTWYDQSGNGYDATQSTAADQPKIYDSATGLITENGKPAIDWGTNQNGKNFSSGGFSETFFSTFSVGRYAGPSPFTNYLGLITYNFAGSIDLTAITNYTGNDWYGSPDIDHYLNGGEESATALPTIQLQFLLHTNTQSVPNKTNIYLGSDRGSSNRGWRGTLQEVIIYNSDQSANRTTIEASINTYYSIY